MELFQITHTLSQLLRIVNSPTVINSTINDEVITLPNGFAILDKNSKNNLDWTPGPFEAFGSVEDISKAFALIPFEADEIKHESERIILNGSRFRLNCGQKVKSG